jgi:hypothetical protein
MTASAPVGEATRRADPKSLPQSPKDRERSLGNPVSTIDQTGSSGRSYFARLPSIVLDRKRVIPLRPGTALRSPSRATQAIRANYSTHTHTDSWGGEPPSSERDETSSRAGGHALVAR